MSFSFLLSDFRGFLLSSPVGVSGGLPGLPALLPGSERVPVPVAETLEERKTSFMVERCWPKDDGLTKT